MFRRSAHAAPRSPQQPPQPGRATTPTASAAPSSTSAPLETCRTRQGPGDPLIASGPRFLAVLLFSLLLYTHVKVFMLTLILGISLENFSRNLVHHDHFHFDCEKMHVSGIHAGAMYPLIRVTENSTEKGCGSLGACQFGARAWHCVTLVTNLESKTY